MRGRSEGPRGRGKGKVGVVVTVQKRWGEEGGAVRAWGRAERGGGELELRRWSNCAECELLSTAFGM